jgi:hypothetical protein
MTGSEEEAPVAAEATFEQPVSRSKIPECFTAQEWAANRQMEGALRPAQRLTLQLEGDMPLGDMACVYIRRCLGNYDGDYIKVPRKDAGAGSSRKFDKMLWTECAEPVRTFRDVFVGELNRRFMNKTPCVTLLALMTLNPLVNVDKILPEAQRRAATVAFDTTWAEASARHLELNPPTAISPTKAKKRRKKAGADSSDDDDLVNLGEDQGQ